MADLADYARPFEQGIMAGAQIGHTIAQNQIERERQRRIMEQAQIANAIQERHTRIQEADAALKAQQFQQAQDFSQLVQQTTPGGGDFNALTPDEQAQAQSTMRERQLQQLPPTLLPKALESSQADYERQQRLEQVLKAQGERTAATQSAYDLRNQARIDEKAAEQDKRIAAAEAAAKKAQEAAQTGREFTQGAIDARARGRAKQPTFDYPSGSPAAIYEKLLNAKESGAESGTVTDTGFDVAVPHWYNSAQPIDALIEKYSAKVPAAAKRKIEAKIAGAAEADQTTPESAQAAEPAAVPVPTQAPGPKEKADMANKIAADNPNWSRAQVLEELAKRLK